MNMKKHIKAAALDVAYAKGIPCTEENLEEVRQQVSEVFGVSRTKIRVRYRGPRAGLGRPIRKERQSYCLKRHAETFAVYIR